MNLIRLVSVFLFHPFRGMSFPYNKAQKINRQTIKYFDYTNHLKRV